MTEFIPDLLFLFAISFAYVVTLFLAEKLELRVTLKSLFLRFERRRMRR